MNAVDTETNRELYSAMYDFKGDADIWIMIVTGAGEKSFSAGADLVAIAEETAGTERIWKWNTPFAGITREFTCWKPLIAAINGYCLGGGLEIALACDIRIAVEHATFGLPEPKVGLLASGGGVQRMIRAVPMAFAMELLLTGNRFDAKTALGFGLISRVVSKDKLIKTAEEIAESIMECGPLSVRATKEAAYRGVDLPLKEGLELEAAISYPLFMTEDAKEGPLAFKEKRKPNWQSR